MILKLNDIIIRLGLLHKLEMCTQTRFYFRIKCRRKVYVRFLPGIYFIFRHVSNGKTRGNKMSNSTSQNGQGKIKKKGSCTRNLPLYLLMIPGLLYLIINNYLPMFGLTFAFKKINYTVGVFESPWVGLDNFTYLFKTSDAFVIFRNTLCYNLAFIVLGTILAIVVAIFQLEPLAQSRPTFTPLKE